MVNNSETLVFFNLKCPAEVCQQTTYMVRLVCSECRRHFAEVKTPCILMMQPYAGSELRTLLVAFGLFAVFDIMPLPTLRLTRMSETLSKYEIEVHCTWVR